jgi:GGDEF domain-containing protein
VTPEQQRIAELEAENARLRETVERLAHDPVYGCYTRAGFELQWQGGGAIVFGDIDHMHRLNNDLGYAQVNEMIAGALSELKTRDDTITAARWWSGDEIIWALPSLDAHAFAERARAVFAAHGLGITLGVALAGDDLQTAVQIAADKVQAAKRRREA